tara:strand:+ start:1609 stop:1806 length:198 start_codon:yes stop_codon:yes gene_type:complete
MAQKKKASKKAGGRPAVLSLGKKVGKTAMRGKKTKARGASRATRTKVSTSKGRAVKYKSRSAKGY